MTRGPVPGRFNRLKLAAEDGWDHNVTTEGRLGGTFNVPGSWLTKR